MIVLDASAALAGLLRDGPAREVMRTSSLHAPHLVDLEIASGLRRLAARGSLEASDGGAALETWGRLGLTRYAVTGLLPRVWELGETVSAYDASYVALAESLDCPMVTADARLGRAPGRRCTVTVVPG